MIKAFNKAKRFLRKNARKNSGFSLLELIVVIAIMGFLVAMIAPRLAGVVGGAVDNTDKTNMSRIAQVTATFNEKNNRYPNGLVNLVYETEDGFARPPVSDNDATNGKEAISSDLLKNAPLKVHYLTAQEAQELRNMGITSVYNLNLNKTADEKYNEGAQGIVASGDYMTEMEVEAGTAVLMIGAGAGEDGTWDSELEGGKSIQNPDLAYRIVLGLGKDNELVKTGQLQNTAISPSGSTSDQYVYNNYMLILPRLKSTVSRDDIPVFSMEVSSEKGEKREVVIAEAHDASNFFVLSPEGKLYPPEQAGNWTIDSVEQ